MKINLFVTVVLSGIGLLLSACSRNNTAVPVAEPPSLTPQIIVVTAIVPETVIVTPTAMATQLSMTPSLTAELLTSVAQHPPTALPTTTPTAVSSLTIPPATVTRTAIQSPTIVPPTPTTALSILYFRANVSIADPGQTIQLEWASVGAIKATQGHLFDGRMTMDQWDLPPSGTIAYTIAPGKRNEITFFLSVVDNDNRWDSAGFTLPLTCPDPWFFNPGPDSCAAAPARVSAGAEQRFENGFMLWEAAERRIYILFNDGSPRWNVIADTWQDGEEICQIEPIPPGRIHPARGFGKAWCSASGLRDRLGWALDIEIGGYQTAVQSTAFDRYNTLYIRAADGGVWKLLTERSGWEKLTIPWPYFSS